MNRRHFMELGLSSLAAAALAPEAFAFQRRDYGGFRMGMQSYSLRNFPMEQQFDMVRDLGLRFLETYNIASDTPAERLEQIKQMLTERNLRLRACGVLGFDGDEAKCRKHFEFAKTMGIRSISADPAPAAFDHLDKLVQEFEINIAIHPHGPGARYPGWRSVQKAIEGRHKRIGICMDVGHTSRANDDAIEGVKTLKDRVYDVHLKDVDANKRDVAIGAGTLNMPEFFKALREVDYQGIVALEYELTPQDPLPGIKQSLEYLKKILAA